MKTLKKFENKRKAGVLMHISSLPGPYGIGSLGREARNFGDFLFKSGQKYWQMLPVGPTGFGDSPYQSFSTFAGNPYFIDLDMLKDEGLLFDEELYPLNENVNPKRVDYSRLYVERFKILKLAFERFEKNSDYYSFVKDSDFWLDDYALFMAIKNKQGGKSWLEWEDGLRKRDKTAIENFVRENSFEIDFYKFIQFKFFSQWKALKEYLKNLDIEIIGDLPIYVSADSADTWSNPKIFKFDENLVPKVVGGVPPDYFSADGQLWGNPIYNWKSLEKDGYKWWIDRVKWNASIFDVLRFDHFRGFESFWEVPYGEKTARNGKWAKGPAMKFFKKLKEELGELNIIAEDLGDLTPAVEKFVEKSGFPGMKILLFSFDDKEDNIYLPHNAPKNSVMYVGTHDNDTILGWLSKASQNEIDFAREYFNLTLEETFNWGLIRGALVSPSNIAIIQMQDILLEDGYSRMNTPGSLGNNWTWRMNYGELSDLAVIKLEKLTRVSKRHNNLYFETESFDD